MRDLLEKYLIIHKEFPNKAGKAAQIMATQKRIIQKLLKANRSPEINDLILAVSEGYDVVNDLLEWNKSVLQGVLNDAEHLAEGARMRNTIKMQSEIICQQLDIKI